MTESDSLQPFATHSALHSFSKNGMIAYTYRSLTPETSQPPSQFAQSRVISITRARAGSPSCGMAKPRNGRLHIIKQEIAAEITRALGPMAPYGPAQRFGVSQPRMSELRNGQVDRCTVDWLLRRAFQMGGMASLNLSIPEYHRRFDRARLH